ALLANDPNADYIILGDLNSEYNETLVIEDRHNDTDGVTGINHVLKAQGDELAVLRGEPRLKYNLHYELERSARRAAWHAGYDWSVLDHMIIGKGMYDSQGITYVDNSFSPAHAGMPRLSFLFNEDGTTRRWIQERRGPHTVHKVGGYSDHA